MVSIKKTSLNVFVKYFEQSVNKFNRAPVVQNNLKTNLHSRMAKSQGW